MKLNENGLIAILVIAFFTCLSIATINISKQKVSESQQHYEYMLDSMKIAHDSTLIHR